MMFLPCACGLLLAALTSGIAAPPAQEEPVAPYAVSDANAGAVPLRTPDVYRDFHGKEGIHRIIADLVEQNLADPRTADIFKAADVIRLKRTLAEQFCYLLDGPCHYTGRDMVAAHKDQGLQTADFNAVVEHLQAAMDREGVPFRAQNQLLAKLAPMKRAMVTR